MADALGMIETRGFAALVDACDAMVKAAGGDATHVIPVHEERLKDMFPSRLTSADLRITELALAEGEPSRVG